MSRVLIGLVGYCQFVRGYVLGPELMARLQAASWPETVEIREMNWGPIAIVQDLQASGERFDRVVLIGAGDRGLAPGTVSVRRWSGRVRDTLAVQRRVFEAVTGVVSVDNLLVIGAHFAVWPDQLYSVEVQLPDSYLGDLVQAEMVQNQQSGVGAVIGERALAPVDLATLERLLAAARAAALETITDARPCWSLNSDQLIPVATVCQYDFASSVGNQEQQR